MRLQYKNETFKILQIADIQEGGKRLSPDTLNLINGALDKEDIDLVVFSGDQIWRSTPFKISKERVENLLLQITEPVRERKIPFTICFGNHDRQVGLSNEEQFEIYKKMDCFVGESVEDTDGCANHIIEVANGDDIKFLLYFFDSHSNLKIGYDNVHQNQIDWYKATRDKYEKENARLIPSIVFQHIPLCEVFELLIEVKKHTKGAVRGFRTHDGKYYILNKNKVNKTAFMKESPADPQVNSNEFSAFKEKGEVAGVYFGHDHLNSFVGKVDSIDLGYTQGAGFHVYGPGKDRGVRVIELAKDSTYSTYDLRYRNVVGNKVKEPLKYAFYQIMPNNMFDALHKAIKFFACLGICAIIILVLIFLFG